MKVFYIITSLLVICLSTVTSQQPEINDQYKSVNSSIVEILDLDKNAIGTQRVSDATEVDTLPKTESQPGLLHRIAEFTKIWTVRVFTARKVTLVLRRIGICLVNGAMEIITYYLPAPFIPLIATAAGLVIPFEPVVLLKEKMPVTSYRRAFNTAVNTFMNMFNKYKMADDDDDDDPYMTRRFNRRFMDNSKEKKIDLKTNKNTDED